MKTTIKTRFAPSPTGILHFGNIRSALYSWLFAHHFKNGIFILRIDDTDKTRVHKKYFTSIINIMKWLNLTWDEGPYFQSHRIHRYNEIINNMLKTGVAYKCFCTKERLIKLRNFQIQNNEKPKYDRFCRYNLNNNIYNTNKNNKHYVVRFCNPIHGNIKFNDIVYGNIEFKNSELDDLILQRSDGSPTYNLCVVVDDYDLNISHVIRGEEHINNTPRQINILRSLNAPIPKYAHLPTILDTNGKKISKRFNPLGIQYYKDSGFIPEAILNYLLKLGWSYGNKEIFSLEEMKKFFTLNKINKSSSIFDNNKLIWINHYYINNLPNQDIKNYFLKYIQKYNINTNIGPNILEIINLSKSRSKTLKDMLNHYLYFYKNTEYYDIELSKQYLNTKTWKILIKIYKSIKNLDSWDIISINDTIKNMSKKIFNNNDNNINELGMPLRIAITGSKYTLPIHIIIYTLGKNITLSRIHYAIFYIYNLYYLKKIPYLSLPYLK